MAESPTPAPPASPAAGRRGPTPKSIAVWSLVALAGAIGWATLALSRGEEVSAAWMLAAALGSYAIAYRFYSRFIANRVLKADKNRATPAERLDNGVDFHPTDRRVLFGHHFAAIAGAGPLVGPVLAAQMGYLPGTIWLVVGVIFAGAVQDMVTLFFSTRRNGRSLGQMARDEIGPVGRDRRPGRGLHHHDHPARRSRAGHRERARALAVGCLLHRHDDPDRPLHGRLSARPAARQGQRGLLHRRRAAAARDRLGRLGRRVVVGGLLHAGTGHPGHLDDRVRVPRLRAPRVAAAGPA